MDIIWRAHRKRFGGGGYGRERGIRRTKPAVKRKAEKEEREEKHGE